MFGGGSCSLDDFQENEDPALQAEGENQPIGEQQGQRRVMTVEDEQEIWKDITLTQYEHTHRTEKPFTFLCQTFTAWLIILWLDWNTRLSQSTCFHFFQPVESVKRRNLMLEVQKADGNEETFRVIKSFLCCVSACRGFWVVHLLMTF